MILNPGRKTPVNLLLCVFALLLYFVSFIIYYLLLVSVLDKREECCPVVLERKSILR